MVIDIDYQVYCYESSCECVYNLCLLDMNMLDQVYVSTQPIYFK